MSQGIKKHLTGSTKKPKLYPVPTFEKKSTGTKILKRPLNNQKRYGVYLIVENVRSLFNVGSFFRCADVFGVDKIYLCGYTGTPPRKEISKVALGAEEIIRWEKKKSTLRLIKKLQKEGVLVVALETGVKAVSLDEFKPRYPLAVVVGNEVEGVSKEVLKIVDKTVEIPMVGQKESLNVSVAAGVAMYALRYRS